MPSSWCSIWHPATANAHACRFSKLKTGSPSNLTAPMFWKMHHCRCCPQAAPAEAAETVPDRPTATNQDPLIAALKKNSWPLRHSFRLSNDPPPQFQRLRRQCGCGAVEKCFNAVIHHGTYPKLMIGIPNSFLSAYSIFSGGSTSNSTFTVPSGLLPTDHSVRSTPRLEKVL